MGTSAWTPVVGNRVTLPEGGEVGEVIGIVTDLDGEQFAGVRWPGTEYIEYQFDEIRPAPAAPPEPAKAHSVSRARGICPHCGRDRALIETGPRAGTMRAHKLGEDRCPGVGQPPKAEEPVAAITPSQPIEAPPAPPVEVAGAPPAEEATPEPPADSTGESAPSTSAPAGPDVSGPRLAALLSRLLPDGATLEALEPVGWHIGYRDCGWTAGTLTAALELVLTAAAGGARARLSDPEDGCRLAAARELIEQVEAERDAALAKVARLEADLAAERTAADRAIHARQRAEAEAQRVEEGLGYALGLIRTLGQMADL